MAKRKPYNIDHSAFETAHFVRIEQYAKLIDKLYKMASDEFGKLSATINFDDSKPFSFNDYPSTKKYVDEILAKLYSQLNATVSNGIEGEWNAANIKNDKVVNEILKTSNIPKQELEKYGDRNLNALNAFQKRKSDGRTYSERIWAYTKDFKTDVEQILDYGLSKGTSAAELASSLKRYLKDPQKRFRRVRDKNGNLIPSRPMSNYETGPGKYKSSYKNAMRLARTEINMSYRTADHERWNGLDFVVGFEVKLSNNPNHCQTCVVLAGKYPKEFKFVGWHPQCRCRAIPILKTEEEMDADDMRMLNGKEPLPFSENKVLDVPPGFKDWIDANKDRSAQSKSQPYFIRDNFKGGKISGGLNFQTTDSDNTSSKTIDLKSMIKGDLPTNKEIKSILLEYANKHPENFRTGLGEVSFRESKSYLMQHTGYSRGSQWVGDAKITISTHTFGGIRFNAAEEIRNAFANIKSGVPLTFNQEYSIESLWHEILHSATKTPPRKLTKAQVEAMETVNQFVARHTYIDFIEALGGKSNNQKEILDNGYGYRSWISNFRAKLAANGISEKTALEELRPILMSDYSKLQFELLKFFARHKKD